MFLYGSEESDPFSAVMNEIALGVVTERSISFKERRYNHASTAVLRILQTLTHSMRAIELGLLG